MSDQTCGACHEPTRAILPATALPVKRHPSASLRTGAGNITVQSQKQQRCKCTTCGKTFSASRGTAFYRLHKKALFVVVTTLLAFGCPPQAIVAAFGLDERTVRAWTQRAGLHGQRVHEYLLSEQPLELQAVQADEIRVRMQGRAVGWMAMAIQVSTRLWLGGVLSPQRDKRLIRALAGKVKACARFGSLLLVSDGLAAYVHAWKSAFRTPVWTGKRGRPRLLEWPVLIGQVIKQKADGHVVGVLQRMAQGSIQQARELGLLRSAQLNTAYIERLNATFRSRLCSLVRRGRALARQVPTLTAGMYLIGCVYNLCTPHKSLRLYRPDGVRKWQARTPAMAAGLSEHRWTVEELMSYRVPPPPFVPPKTRGRPTRTTRAAALAGCGA